MALTVVTESPDVKNYDKETLMKFYEGMRKIRTFDQQLIRLMQEGKVSGFYHSGQGQEAIAVGTCAPLNDQDCVYYAHRGCNTMIAKGVSLTALYGDFLMRVCGTTRGLGAGIVHSADPSVGVLGQSGTVGESMVLGPGTAYALKYKKTDNVCVSYFGDGASARELFHGGMNFAGCHQLPMIFVCENNGWAISSSFEHDHSVKEHIAERAEGYCIPAYVVNGNDVLAVYETMKKVVDNARAGGGPAFLECKTYRHRGHFEGDPYDYVDKDVLKDWKDNKDPINTFQAKIVAAGIATDDEFKAIDDAILAEVNAAIDEAEASPLPPKERIFEGLFVEEEVC